MARKVLTNAGWAQLSPLFPRKGPQAKRRLRLEGILWIHRTGAPWRDLPACFGKWGPVQSCFYRWDDSGLWARIWQRMRDALGEDPEALYIDSTAVSAHRQRAGARPAANAQAIGVSRGGRGTKVHAVCDALGYPVAVKLTGAQASDVSQARTMLEDQQAERIVADRGDDCDRLRAQIASQGAEPVIPGRKTASRRSPTINTGTRAVISWRTSFAASPIIAAWPPATRKPPVGFWPWLCSLASSFG